MLIPKLLASTTGATLCFCTGKHHVDKGLNGNRATRSSNLDNSRHNDGGSKLEPRLASDCKSTIDNSHADSNGYVPV